MKRGEIRHHGATPEIKQTADFPCTVWDLQHQATPRGTRRNRFGRAPKRKAVRSNRAGDARKNLGTQTERGGVLLYINGVYGYRIPMSMKNRVSWQFPHSRCGKSVKKDF